MESQVIISQPAHRHKIPITREELKLLMHLRNWQRRVISGEVTVQVVIKNGCFRCKEVR
jgi:hypothetical protein